LATADELKRYHSPAYVGGFMNDSADVDYLLGSEGSDDSSDEPQPKRVKSEKHGFEHVSLDLSELMQDCPAFSLLPDYSLQVAAATLTACRLLARGQADIAINWDGGRHHALRSRASGFCYVADVVLGIMLLLREGKTKTRPRPRVLYLDFDLHYGDGVALAFHSPTSQRKDKGQRKAKPPQVLTLSVHHSASTFFPPPTPLSLLPAAETTSPFTSSIPLLAYPSRATYAAIFPSVERIYQAYKPDYVVLQLGADGLPGDPIGQWGNWSSHGGGGMLWVAEKVKSWGVPLCILGGGGYNNADAARAWAGVTAVMVSLR
jgi:acetoin utilization deacetylase AcuC-like enzyme